jgi:FkbM family methyltransferase
MGNEVGRLGELLGLAQKSVLFDWRLARAKALPQSRVIMIAGKYVALAQIAAGKGARLQVGGQPFVVDTISTLGTLQSCIVDVADVVVGAQILGARPFVIDIGANVGQFCAAMKLYYPHSRVFSIEADPVIYQDLVRNTARMSDVSTICAALGDTPTIRTFYRHALSSMSSFVPYPDHSYATESVIDFPITRLDDMKDWGAARIDLLKVDVEGFEWAVLQGATETLRRVHYLLLEIGLGRSLSKSTNLDLLA